MKNTYYYPVVVYLKNTVIKECVQEISKERDDKWFRDVIKYHTSQGYVKSCGYKGFEGYIECLKARQERELTILDNFDIDKIIIENPFINWKATYEIIKNYLDNL